MKLLLYLVAFFSLSSYIHTKPPSTYMYGSGNEEHDRSLERALWLACAKETEKLELVKNLVKVQGVTKSAQVDSGKTAFDVACSKNYAHIAKLLLEHNVDACANNTEKLTKHLASACTEYEDTLALMKTLLEYGADSKSPLMLELYHFDKKRVKHHERLELLKQWGFSNFKHSNLVSMLWDAVIARNMSEVKFLISFGVNKTISGNEKTQTQPAFMYVANKKDNVELIELLYKHDVDNCQTDQTLLNSALEGAVTKECLENAKVLLKWCKFPDKSNLLYRAAVYKPNIKMVQLLLDNGFPAQTVIDGRNLFDMVREPAIHKLLKQHGATSDIDVQHEDPKKNTSDSTSSASYQPSNIGKY